MTSTPAEENERNLPPTGNRNFQNSSNRNISTLQSKFPLTILITIKLNTRIIQDISELAETNIKIKQTRFQLSLNTKTFRLTCSGRLFSTDIPGCSVYCTLLLQLDWVRGLVMQDIPFLATVNLRVLQLVI